MNGRRFWTAFSFGLAWSLGSAAALSLSGCAPAIGLYHGMEGGAISQDRQPPPGMDQPYPNLANVPAAPAPVPANAQAAITAQARSGVSAPAPGALAGLSLPTAAPPLPDVPGLNLPAQPTPVQPAMSAPAAGPSAAAPAPPPIAIGFSPRSALLQGREASKIAALAGARGAATVLACGYGDGSLDLALNRARRLADALTAAGVPPGAIRLSALAAGSGGFVQLVY